MDAELKTVNVRAARPDEMTGNNRATDFEKATGEYGGAGTVIVDHWKYSLQDSLDRKLIFRDNVSRTVTISVVILKFSAPDLSFSRFTEVEARYEVMDRGSGAIIWTKTIPSEGRASVGEAFLGSTGFRLSINKAVQTNIEAFLDQLEASIISGELR